jgi:Tol biopolymer transport system component
MAFNSTNHIYKNINQAGASGFTRIKYSNLLILFAAFLLAPLLTGCFSEIEGTQKKESAYSGINHSGAGFTTDNKYAYYSRSKGGEANIYLKELGATTEISLTSDSSENLCVRGGVFGNDILFSSNKSGTFRIYKMALNGTSPVDILRNLNYNFLDAAFSKNGQFVVFSAVQRTDSNYSQICTADTGGGNFKQITSTDSLKRKPTVSADNTLVMFQKKVNNNWGLYYVDLKADDKIEHEFLVETNLDAFDPEFLSSNAQSVKGAEEIIYIHGKIGVSVRMERSYIINKAIKVVKNFSNYYYFDQPAVSADGSKVLFLQKIISGNRFDVWKTDLNGTSFGQFSN